MKHITWIIIGWCLLYGGGCKKGSSEDPGWWLEQARVEAEGISDEVERDAAYIEIAELQLAAGDIAGAKATAASVNDGEKPWLICKIIKTQAQEGDVSGARATAANIEYSSFRDLAYCDIIAVQAEAGDVSKARAMAERIETDLYRSMAYSSIAQTQAAAGELAAALLTAREIGEPNYIRYLTYSKIAEDQADRGNIAEALKIAAEIETEPYRSQAYGAIAEAQVQAGDIRAALAMTVNISEVSDKVLAYCEAARAQAQRGDRKAARQTFKKAWTMIGQLNKKDHEMGLHRFIVKSQLEAEEAAEAWIAAEKIEDVYERGWAFHDISKVLAGQGEIEEAKIIAANIEIEQIKDRAYFYIALEQAKRGNIEGTWATAANILNPEEKVLVHCQVANKQAEGSDREKARATLQEALALGGGCQHLVVEEQLKMGDLDGAWQTVRNIDNDDIEDKKEACRALGKAQARTGDYEMVLQWAELLNDCIYSAYLYLGAAEGLPGDDTSEDEQIKNESSGPKFLVDRAGM